MKIAKGQIVAAAGLAIALAWGMIGTAAATTGAVLYCTYQQVGGTAQWVDRYLKTPSQPHCPATSTRNGMQGELIDEEVVD